MNRNYSTFLAASMVLPALLAALPSFAANRGARPSSDLAITLTAAPNPVKAGAQLTYTAVLVNLGPDAAMEVVIVMPLPAGTTLVSAALDGNPFACRVAPQGVVRCQSSFGLGWTTTATPRTATIIVEVASGTTGSLTGTATAEQFEFYNQQWPPFDPDLSNNEATLTTTVGSSATATASVPSLNRLGVVLVACLLGLVGLIAARPLK